MWNQRHGLIACLAGALSCAAPGEASSCRGDALRPSAVPPTEGVWSVQQANGAGRVAVMLGPAELRAGAAVVTRRVEAIETGDGAERRTAVDTAVVHLDLLPSYGSAASEQTHEDSRSPQSAAVYAITPLVLIAAYEPCADVGAPAIRYLRRDARGRIAVDAMLHRDTGAREQ